MEADDDVFHDAEDELSDHEQHEATTSGGGTHFGTPLPEPACEAGDGDGDAVAGGATAEDHLPLHRAAFNGDLSALDAALTALPPARWTELDDCGNTALHVAVLRRKAGCVALLLQRGFPPKQKSSAGWAAIYEAIAAGNEPLVLALHTAAVRADEAAYKRRKPELLAALAALPDFRCALRWEFCSPIFAPLLRVFAPHDTYTLTKRGTSLRIDGSLKGLVDDESSGDGGGGSLMPQWDRGAFSLLFSASAAAPTPAEDGSVALAPPQLLLSDHDTRETVDALPPGAARSDAELAEEAAALLAAGAAKSKMRAREFSFAPQRTWRGAVKREKAEGWQTTVYEAKGRVEAQQRLRSGRFALRGSFEQYLASAADGAADELVTLDLAEEMENEEGSAGGGGGDSGSAGGSDAGAGELGADSGASGGASTPPGTPRPSVGTPPPSRAAAAAKAKAAKAAKPSKPRAFTGKCWMAEGHPLSVRALFPLLDVCASVNKHFMKVRKFLTKWADVDACPVRLQVPLMMTVYVQVAIRDFELLTPAAAAALPPGFFAPPPGYHTMSLEEKLDAMEAKMEERNRASGGGGSDDGGAGAEEAAEGGPRPRRRRSAACGQAAAAEESAGAGAM